MATEILYQPGEGKGGVGTHTTASTTPWKHTVMLSGDKGGMVLSGEGIKIQDTGISH